MIEVDQLSKNFGSKKAVDGISFKVQKGEVLGFLGPNGAGKSTTMRMITGFFAPTSGSVRLDGISITDQPKQAKKKFGYLPESAPLYTDMTVSAFLRFAAEMRGLRGGSRNKAVEQAIETCFLQKVRNQSIDTLSKGYRHRTCLAQSLIHDPEILILDEPTDGLDPNQKHEVRDLIKRMGETKAIIFSTHILEEVEAACSRAIIIDQGKVVADGTPDELRARDKVGVRVRISGATSAKLQALLSNLGSCSGVDQISSEENSLEALLTPKANKMDALEAEVFKLAVDEKLTLSELAVQEGRLDNVFRMITRSDTQ